VAGGGVAGGVAAAATSVGAAPHPERKRMRDAAAEIRRNERLERISRDLKVRVVQARFGYRQ
jgi:hypothetical protein